MIDCIGCHRPFQPVFNQVVCSPFCEYFSHEMYDYHEPNPKFYSKKRRARMKQGDQIVPLIVFEMYDWTCCICHERIEPHRRVPDHKAATIEHLKPISMGGEHLWSNVYPSHLRCNELKADSRKSAGGGFLSVEPYLVERRYA